MAARMLTTAEILETRAKVMPARRGWLAVSAPDSGLSVGVVGVDEEDARARFQAEIKAWADLHDLPEPD